MLCVSITLLLNTVWLAMFLPLVPATADNIILQEELWMVPLTLV